VIVRSVSVDLLLVYWEGADQIPDVITICYSNTGFGTGFGRPQKKNARMRGGHGQGAWYCIFPIVYNGKC
jgi:hypothetical protein